MKQTTFDPSKELQIFLRVARDGSKSFVFTSSGVAYNLSALTFQLFVKNFPHSSSTVISLTIANGGLSIGGTGNGTLSASFTVAETTLKAKDYYWELYCITTRETWLNGICIIHDGQFDGVDSDTTDLTINLSGGDVDVEITAGTGGLSTVTTDGDTIQGDGSSGSPVALKKVYTNASLTGDGTSGNPLIVATVGTIDPAPVNGSANAVASGGVFTALADKLEKEDALTSYNSANYTVTKATFDTATEIRLGSSVTTVTVPSGLGITSGRSMRFKRLGTTAVTFVQSGTVITPSNGTLSDGGFQSCLVQLTYTGSETFDLENGAPAIPVRLIPTAVKTATTYTAAASDFVPCDTTSNNITITLPTAPADQAQIGIKQVIRGGTNTITIAAGGSDVFNKVGGSTTLTITLLFQGVIIQYKASTAIWYVLSDDFALSQLDARYPLGSGTSTGTNTGDQTIQLTGDVTGTGVGTFATTIRNDVALAGNPTTTTQSAGNNTTRLATTAFVTTAVAAGSSGLSIGKVLALARNYATP